MSKPKRDIKWRKVDEAAAKALTKKTDAPNGVYQVPAKEIPDNFKTMAGITSFFVSGYVDQRTMDHGLTLGGEMAVIRFDGLIAKNYNYVFASSTDGNIYQTGPFKDFPHHHSPSASPVKIEDLFGHAPFVKGKKP